MSGANGSEATTAHGATVPSSGLMNKEGSCSNDLACTLTSVFSASLSMISISFT